MQRRHLDLLEPGDGRVLTRATLLVATDADSFEPGATITVRLTVRNDGRAAVVLRFASAQRYDVEIRHAGGRSVWRWGEGVMFAEVMGEERIAAGGALEFTERCPAPTAPGRYEVIGRIPAMGGGLEGRREIAVR